MPYNNLRLLTKISFNRWQDYAICNCIDIKHPEN